jgi:septum formation protein
VRLVLASASPARVATLTSAGIPAEVRVSGVDEDAALAVAHARHGRLGPADDVIVLARAKAEAVADDLRTDGVAQDGVVVLGCDSLLELGGRTYGKPADAADAIERWQTMRGRSGVLHTGHWLVDQRTSASGADETAANRSGLAAGGTSSTVVHFADLSDAEIDAYVATGEPLAVAGAFTVDGLGGPFVTGIEGDYHTVVGLSLPLLRDLLGELGIAITDLWA